MSKRLIIILVAFMAVCGLPVIQFIQATPFLGVLIAVAVTVVLVARKRRAGKVANYQDEQARRERAMYNSLLNVEDEDLATPKGQ